MYRTDLWTWERGGEGEMYGKSKMKNLHSDQISCSVMSDSLRPHVAARQASLSITNSQSSLRLTSIESVMPSIHLILCHPFLLLPPIPPSIRLFSNESTLHMRWPSTGVSALASFITIGKIGSQQEFDVWLRKLKKGSVAT